MNMFKKFLGFLMVFVFFAGSALAVDVSNVTVVAPAKKVVSPVVSDDFKKDWSSIRSEHKDVKDEMKAAKDQEQVLKDQIQAALKSGDKDKAEKLREELHNMHAEHMKKFQADKKESKNKKEVFLEDVKKSTEPPRGRGKYLESNIQPGKDARNRHTDRRDNVDSRSGYLKKRTTSGQRVDGIDDQK